MGYIINNTGIWVGHDPQSRSALPVSGAISQTQFRFYHQPLVQLVSHAAKRTKHSMQSPPILRTRNKRFFIR
jgi:hypothetical protein